MSLTAAELRKLAHTLGVKPDRVEMLAHLPAEDVRALRRQVAEALFQADRPHFVRVANIAKAVPVPIAAKVTQAVLPPLLAARSAELLDPARAAELVARLPDAYLADVSAAMDASRAPEVVAAIPPDRVARVGAELARRQEWVVIGGFVSAVDEQALAESIAIFDGEQLLRIGWVLEDPSRADAIAGVVSDEQVADLVAAPPRADLWAEFASLAGQLAPPRLQRLAAAWRAADADLQHRYRTAAADGTLDAALLASLEA